MEMSEFWPTMAANFRDWPPADEIAAVRALIGDPPAVVPDVDWDGVHARLGLRLPADYRAFIDSYGPGTVGDIRIMAPGQPAEWDLFALLDRKQAQGMILPLYPEPGGAVSWGETAGGHTLCWAPAGADPDRWLVVAIGPGAGLPGFGMTGGLSFTATLRGLLDEGAPQTLVPPLPPRAPTAGQVRFSPRQQP